MTTSAPLFELFWKNSELNASRAQVLGQQIAADAMLPPGTPPPVYNAAAVPLTDAPAAEAAIWARRASGRQFGTAPATLDALGQVLHPLREHAGQATRILPSGGGKYPLHVYLALCRVDGEPALQGQIAWYDYARHGLTPIRACPSWPDLARALAVDWNDEPAAVAFVIGRPGTMLNKYGERGGRFMLMEAGVYLGALSHQVAARDWAGCAIGSFHDPAVLELLGLDPAGHLAVLAYAFGPRP